MPFRQSLVLVLVSCWVLAAGCSGARRATVHEQDMTKVFPWPGAKQSITIRVRPQTTMANMCVWFGSWEEVEVTPQTTFYIVDQAGHKFAYTPARSPIRRLAPLDSMEIRWPPQQAAVNREAGDAGAEAKPQPEAATADTGTGEGEKPAQDGQH